MSTHTPGPWKTSITRDGKSLIIRSLSGELICTVDNDQRDGDIDANLISAAPEMLDMLRKCRSVMMSGEIEYLQLDDLLNRIDNG